MASKTHNKLKSALRTKWGWLNGLIFCFSFLLTSGGGYTTLAILSGALLAPDELHAQGKKQNKYAGKTRKTPVLSNRVYEKVAEVQAALSEQDNDKAIAILDKLRDKAEQLNSYELASVWNFYAYIFYTQEKYAKALQAYQEVIKSKDIPLSLEISSQYSIAQLYFVQEKYRQAVNALNQWFELVEKPNLQAYIMLSQGYFQIKNYRKSIANVKKAMAVAKESGKEIRENWYLLLRAAYYEDGDMQSVAKVLQDLIRFFPKKDYWLQLSGVYGELNQELPQLFTLEVAYGQGFLVDQKHIERLAYLYLNSDVPYRGAVILDKGIRDKIVKPDEKIWELLGNAWYNAQEHKKAINALKEAAKITTESRVFLRLANAHMEQEDYTQAVKAIRKALEHMDEVNLDTQILLATALYNEGELQNALEVFNEAAVLAESEEDENNLTNIDRWQKFLVSEINRRTSLGLL